MYAAARLLLASSPLLASAVPRPLQPDAHGVVSTYRPEPTRADTALKEKRQPTAILHVGPHKMGSTSVQAAVYTFHSQLTEDGFMVPGILDGYQRLYAAASYLRCPKGVVEPCPHMTCPLKCDDYEVQQGWGDLWSALDTAREEGKGVILSAEDFDRPDVRVKELFNALHGFNVTTVVMYRHYFEWIASVYGHLRAHELYALECAVGIPEGCYGSVGWEERRTNTLEDAARRYTPLVKWLRKDLLDRYLEIFTPEVLRRFAEFGAVDTIMIDAQTEGTPEGTLEEAFLCRGATPKACEAAREAAREKRADASVRGKRLRSKKGDALVLKNEADTIGTLALELAVVASIEGLLPASADAHDAVSRLTAYMTEHGTGFVPVHCFAEPHADRTAILRRSDQLWEVTETAAREVLSLTKELMGRPLVGLEMDSLKEAYANSSRTKLCSVNAKGVHESKAVQRVLDNLFPEYAAQRTPSEVAQEAAAEPAVPGAQEAAEPAVPGCGPYAQREECHPMTPNEEDGGGTYTDTENGICLPICYSDRPNVAQDWETKCHWMQRCKDCKECDGEGSPSRVMARISSRKVKKDAPKALDDGLPKPPQQEEPRQAPAAPNEDEPKALQAPREEAAPRQSHAPKEASSSKERQPPKLVVAPKEWEEERDDLPCDDGPYILDLCDCGEGLGSSINFHKTALTYATALGAKYIDLPLRHGEKIESAEPLPDDANVRRANVAAAQPPRSAKQDIFDGHDRLNYSPFFGLGSKRCNAASLKAHRAALAAILRANGTAPKGHLTFVDADQQQIEPTDKQSRVSNVNWLCARMESELINNAGDPDPPSALFDTDPTLSHVSRALGGHTRSKLEKLVLVFDYEFNHPDLGFCAISPEFRQRWRKAQHLEARPRSLKHTPISERVIAVHFRWGDTATADVNEPNRIGHRTVPLRELAKVATTVRKVLGGPQVRVLLFTEPSHEDLVQGRSEAEVVAEFDDFTKAVPNTELRLGQNTETRLGQNPQGASGRAMDVSTARDLIDMAQADALIGGSSSFFELAAHLSEAPVFTSQPHESAWSTAATPPTWQQAWGQQPNVTKRVSRWGKHIGLVGFDSSGPKVVFTGAWWDEHGGYMYSDTETETDADADANADASTDAGLCLPICYSESPGIAQDWATKCTWTKRCTDCPECTGPGFMNTDSNTATATETDASAKADADAGLCLPICYSDGPGMAHDWATKCTWTKRCTDCKECDGLGHVSPSL